jgi:hypothetical protein
MTADDMGSAEDMIRAQVRLLAAKCSAEEIAALNICIQLGGDPTVVIGYEKVRALFTQANGTQVHSIVAAEWARIAIESAEPLLPK